MKYSEYNSKSKFKGSPAFYIIAACCLLAIGGASWFAAANIAKRSTDKSYGGAKSDISDFSSAESIGEPIASEPKKAENTEKHISSIPYSSSENGSLVKSEPREDNVYCMPIQGEIIKKYNDTELQYSTTYGDMRLHLGIDIACEAGTSVSACGSGKILSVEKSAELGNTVTVEHGNGITAKYASLDDVKLKTGDKVAVGDIIGTVSSVPCECADQSHLHFEVYKDGHPASPLDVLRLGSRQPN